MDVSEHDGLGASVETVVRELGITARTLRYYEEVGLITPSSRTPGGHRLYDSDAVERLRHVIRLKENLGASLQEIRDVLQLEESLDDLRRNFRESGHDRDRQRDLLNTYIDTLQDLVCKMNHKIESLAAMKETYQQRLDKAIRSRAERFEDR